MVNSMKYWFCSVGIIKNIMWNVLSGDAGIKSINNDEIMCKYANKYVKLNNSYDHTTKCYLMFFMCNNVINIQNWCKCHENESQSVQLHN